MESLGVGLLDSIMTLFAFLPILYGLSKKITELPWIGQVDHALIWVAILAALGGTVLLAAVQGYGGSVGLENSGNGVSDPGLYFKLTTVITLVAGTMFLMWLGEQITQRGIGNGISLIIFSGIVA